MEYDTGTIPQKEKRSKLVGGCAVVLFHLLFLLFVSTSGFRPISSFPHDSDILIEFLSDATFMIPRAIPGEEPQSPNPNPYGFLNHHCPQNILPLLQGLTKILCRLLHCRQYR